MSGEALNGKATTIMVGRRRGEPSPGTVPSSTLENLTSKTRIVVLLGQHRPDKADQGVAVGENADDVGAAADLPVQPLLRVVAPNLPPQLLGVDGEGEDVRPGLLEVFGDLGQLVGERLDDPVELGVHRRRVGLVIHTVQQRLTQPHEAFGVTAIRFAA